MGLFAFPCTLPPRLRADLQKLKKGNASRIVDVPLSKPKDSDTSSYVKRIKDKALRWQMEFAWGLRQEVYISPDHVAAITKPVKAEQFFAKACKMVTPPVPPA